MDTNNVRKRFQTTKRSKNSFLNFDFISGRSFVIGILFFLNTISLAYIDYYVFVFSNYLLLSLFYIRNSSKTPSTHRKEATSDSKPLRHVLITGCDSGFGRGAALQLNQQQVFVFAACLTDSAVQIYNDDTSFNGLAFVMNVTKTDDIERAKFLIGEQLDGNGLWGLVNNAGVLHPGPIEWQSLEEMQTVMNVNLWGSVNVTKKFLPFIKKAQGRIVNISSMAGRVLFPHYSSYSMSKFALEAFSDGLRYEMKPWNVSVHIIEPGMFKTSILDSHTVKQKWSDIWGNQPNQITSDYGEEYFTAAVESTQDLLDKLASPAVDKVINTICHATTSENPNLRYSVGFDANTLWMAIATLPTCVGDFIVSSVSKALLPSAMKR